MRDGFDNFLSKLGLNNDNTLSGGGYEFNLITRNRILLEAAYRGSWLVGVGVDSVAEDMTRAGVEVTTSEGDGDLPKFDREFSRLRIWWSLCLLIKWGRLYGGALGILQIEGQDPASPLRVETIGKDQFKGLTVFDRWQLNPVLTPAIGSGPEIGLPALYQIVNDPRSYDPKQASATGLQVVHHTRCIRMTGIDLPWYQAITEMMWGESILERLWDRLIAFDNATLSSAQLIDRANLRTVGVKGLREIIAAGGTAIEGLTQMFNMVRTFQTNEGLTLLDSEDVFTTTAYSFAGLSDMMLQFGQQVSGAWGVPLMRLFGQSPAGLGASGDNDIRIYYDNINSQQESKLRNGMDTLIKVMWASKFGKPAPDDLEFKFKPLWQMSAVDKANVAKTTTDTVIAANQAGLVSTEAGMKELRDSASESGLFSNITDEDIKDAEGMEPPSPDLPGGGVESPKEPKSDETKSSGKKVSAQDQWWRWWKK